jgi:capsular exopolysaccharide synthesis family protein
MQASETWKTRASSSSAASRESRSAALSAAAPAAHLVSLVAPTSFEAEQYRMVRHVVERRHQETGLSVVAVTSPGGSEGKTTTAINLAGALAQAVDQRVMLVEADLRRPRMLEQLGLPPAAAGLAEAALDPAKTLDDVCQNCPTFNLTVLPAGNPPMAPYEILRSPRIPVLLAEARRRYDYVIVDTPPVVPCPDYRLIEPSVDGAILVVAADKTPREMVDSALDLLDRGKTLGLLFNGGRGSPEYEAYGYADPAAARGYRQWFTPRRWFTRRR